MASQKSKFLAKALDIIETKPGVFKALEEFEKTGKTITKTRLNFTIDRVIAKNFRNYCKKNNINMSEQIERLLRNYIKDK